MPLASNLSARAIGLIAIMGTASIGAVLEGIAIPYLERTYYSENAAAEDLRRKIRNFGDVAGADVVSLYSYAPDHSTRKREVLYLDRGLRNYQRYIDEVAVTTSRDQARLLRDHKEVKCFVRFAVEVVFMSELIHVFALRGLDSIATYPIFSPETFARPKGELIGYVDWQTTKDTAIDIGASRDQWRRQVCSSLKILAEGLSKPLYRHVRAQADG